VLQVIVTLQMLGKSVTDRMHREDTGAAAIEYALIAGLIALAIVAAATALGVSISGVFNRIVLKLNGVAI
jgi:pilus assembly protein Flp/PilA